VDAIAQLFDRMDAWRHLPDYQLERRADLFFSLYLPEVLQAKLGFVVRPEIVPEFPLRLGTLYPGRGSNRSVKVDYLALSADGGEAILVELKTDGNSRRDKQDAELAAAREAGMPRLLEGVIEIFHATVAKGKYIQLLNRLGRLGLVEVQTDLCEKTANSCEVKVTCLSSRLRIIYVQPTADGADTISFDEFRAVVAAHGDPVSARFAVSLKEWADVEAGRPIVQGAAKAD
jgi:hypothetical protein